jgi:hypothetical protein
MTGNQRSPGFTDFEDRPMCMHIFCYDCLHRWLGDKKRSCPLCRTRVLEQPVRDSTFEVELEAAIGEGRVMQVEMERITETLYEWAGVEFTSA